MPVYRYRQNNIDIEHLNLEVPKHSVVMRSYTPRSFVDVEAEADDKEDLDESMSARGFTFVAEDPANEESSSLKNFLDTAAIVEDPPTGIKGRFLDMQVLMHRREIFNDSENPLYDANVTPLIGSGGSVTNLNNIHSKLGWHNQEIIKATYRRPKDLLIYYGYLNSFNSGTHGWDNEKVAQEMAQYSLLVFGDGIQDPSHPDYANTQIIIPRIKQLNPYAKIFGYISVNQALSNFETKAGQWETLQVDGIFMDEAGYDYGTPATNGRDAFNTKVDYVHGQTHANLCFVNAWNMDNIIGTTDDPSYPNSTWNPSLNASHLTENDWYLLESFAVNTTVYSGGYTDKTTWAARGEKAKSHRAYYGINLAAVGIIDNGNVAGEDLFDFHFISSLMYSLEAQGSSDTSYGAGGAVDWWPRPDVIGMGRLYNLSPSIQEDVGDAEVYLRYVDAGRFKLDFSAGAQLSSITKW
jgi:hypothetical protein